MDVRKYLIAYAAWLGGVLTMGFVALAWYRYVEQIDVRELLDRIRQTPGEENGTDTEG